MKQPPHGNSGKDDRKREVNQRQPSVGRAVGDFAATAASALFSHQGGLSATSNFAESTVAPEFRSVAIADFPSIVNRDTFRAEFGAPFVSTDDSTKPTGVAKFHADNISSRIYPCNKQAFVETSKYMEVAKRNKTASEEKIEQPMEVYGWNPREIHFAPLCPYFPMDMVKAELPRSEFPEVQTRLERFFKADSIQAVFINQPASAKLQTVDGVEFRLQFWEAKDKTNFYVDVQRYRGDHMQFHKTLDRLMDAVKGILRDAENVSPPPMDLNKLHEFHSIMERIAPSVAEQTEVAVHPVERVVDYTHSALTSSSFADRTPGLRCLMNATDLRSTSTSMAVQAALIFLRGHGPTVTNASRQEELNRKAAEIQGVLFSVLAKGEYEADGPLKEVLHDKPHTPFLSGSRKRKQAGRYEDGMVSTIHKVLSILVSCLEAVSVGSESNEEIIEDFLFQFQDRTNTDMYAALLEFMENSSDQMAIGYLSCKTMRLMASMSPSLKGRLNGDAHARAALDKACRTGSTCHCLLESESKMLQNAII
mmetsp:Transcript_110570/g.319484  ORF Transcript_110570/g.319484 Transcript_110570/m.319484 type:complete len:536 (-) Transcript_110570:267-1874(-)